MPQFQQYNFYFNLLGRAVQRNITPLRGNTDNNNENVAVILHFNRSLENARYKLTDSLTLKITNWEFGNHISTKEKKDSCNSRFEYNV